MRISDWSSDVCSSDLQYCHSAVEKLNDAAPQFSKSNACFWQRHRPYPSCGAAIRLCPRSSCLDDKPFNAVADKQALAQLRIVKGCGATAVRLDRDRKSTRLNSSH